MEVSKVVYGERALIDLTEDTVTAGDLRTGVTAHNAKGEKITGEWPKLTQLELYGTMNMVSFWNTTIIGAATNHNAVRSTPREGYKGEMYFLAPCNGYLHMMTDDKSTDGLKTECYLMSD